MVEASVQKGWVETFFALVVEEETRVTFAALTNTM